MKSLFSYTLLLLAFNTFGLQAQSEFKKEWLLGYGLNSHGVALHFKKYSNKLLFKDVNGPDLRLELGNMVHPREISVINGSVSNGSTYKFAKVNYTWIIRPSAECRVVLARRTSRKSIGVNAVFGVGLPVAYSWPIFVKLAVYDTNSKTENFLDVMYDPEKHPQSNIGGKSSWVKGFDIGNFIPGVCLQGGFEFKTGDFSDEFKVLGLGFRVEAFSRKIPTYYKSQLNQSLITSFYLNFGFGWSK